MLGIRLLDVRQPAITPDLKDVQNRLKIHHPTLVTRKVASSVFAGLFAAAVMKLTGADRAFYGLPVIALAGAIGWDFYEHERCQDALDMRAAFLFHAPGDVPKDVKDYIDLRPKVLAHVSKEHLKEKLENYCSQAVKEGRLAIAEYLLANKFVKLADGKINLQSLDDDISMNWLFKYSSLGDSDKIPAQAYWEVAFRTKKNVTDSPLFEELVADLMNMKIEDRLPIVLKALVDERKEILEAFHERCVLFEEFFFAECPDAVFKKIDKKALRLLTKYLSADHNIANRLWQKMCDLNYIDEDLYKLYMDLTPNNRADLLAWDLGKAEELGATEVIRFMREKGHQCK